MHKSVWKNSERPVTPSQKRPVVERIAKPDIKPCAAEVRFVRIAVINIGSCAVPCYVFRRSPHRANQAVEPPNLYTLSVCPGDTKPVGHGDLENCQHALQTSPRFNPKVSAQSWRELGAQVTGKSKTSRKLYTLQTTTKLFKFVRLPQRPTTALHCLSSNLFFTKAVA